MVGTSTPKFDVSGHVTDVGPNVTRDLKDFLSEARKRNILVTLSLWNGAALSKCRLRFKVKGFKKNLH